MCKVLILGCTGFIGRNIAETFSENKKFQTFGTSFTSWDFPKKGTEVYTVNLTLEPHVNRLFKSIKPDIVIQAAAVTSGSKDIIERPYIHVTDNAVMNSLILRACYEYGVKHFIFLSCGVMYQPGKNPRKEEDFNEHDSIYLPYFGVGWTKVYIEKMCEFYSRLGRTKHTVIRHSNSYGAYDKYDLEYSHIFGATVRKVMDAKDGESIKVWGSGEDTKRDLLYVSDVVSFIQDIIIKQRDSFELVNLGYGKAFSVKEIVESIIKVSGKDLSIIYDTSKPVIPTTLALDSSKAIKKYGWQPKISFIDGIKRTLDWYETFYKKNINE